MNTNESGRVTTRMITSTLAVLGIAVATVTGIASLNPNAIGTTTTSSTTTSHVATTSGS